jgi:peptidoglycan-associated lipoprotein
MKLQNISIALTLALLSGCTDPKPAVDDANAPQNVAQEKPEKSATSHADNAVPDDKVMVTEDRRVPGVTENNSNAIHVDNIGGGFEIESAKIYFDFDKFNVRADMRSTIEEVVSKVDGLAANEKIKIEGNCDEWGTDEYNYALGLKRAKSVKTQLSKLGVDAKRLSLISYGESNPMCSSKTDNCWSQNRRVEFKILP